MHDFIQSLVNRQIWLLMKKGPQRSGFGFSSIACRYNVKSIIPSLYKIIVACPGKARLIKQFPSKKGWMLSLSQKKIWKLSLSKKEVEW